MIRTVLNIAFVMTVLARSVDADQAHYVAPFGSNVPPYDTWQNAATSIAAAVSEAYNSGSGYPVVVTDGFYQVSQPIVLDFPVTLRSVNGPALTVIDANYASPCLWITGVTVVADGFTLSRGSGNSGSIRVAAGTLRNCTVKQSVGNYFGGIFVELGGAVENCLIVSNTATHAYQNGGGGVAIWQSGTLRTSTVVSNSSLASGGGVFCYAGGTVADCTIAANTSSNSSGGGVVTIFPGAVISNCLIRGNFAKQFGGGVHCYYGGTVVDCRVVSNSSTVVGGGLSLYEGGLACNSLIYGNRCSNDGGGICFTAFSNLVPIAEHCTVVSNRAATNAAGIGCNISGGTGRIYNSIIYFNLKDNGNTDNWGSDNNDIKYTMCCTTPSHSGTGNITGNPDLSDRSILDLSLLGTSPCIDTGSNLTDVVEDINHAPRPLNGDNSGKAFSDMGAYEYIHPAADTDHDLMPDAWEIAGGISAVASNDAADSDADRSANVEEYIAGTSPSDPTSVFHVVSITLPATNDSHLVMSWNTLTGRSYSVYSTTNLLGPGGWQTNMNRVAGSGGAMTYTNVDSEPVRNFRLTVTKP